MNLVQDDAIAVLESGKDVFDLGLLVGYIRGPNLFEPGDILRPICRLYKEDLPETFFIVVQKFDNLMPDFNKSGKIISYNLELLKMRGNRLLNHSEFWPHYLFEKVNSTGE